MKLLWKDWKILYDTTLLIFLPSISILLHPALLLLQFCPDLSFISWLFKTLIISLLWSHDSQSGISHCLLCLHIFWLCPWKRARSHRHRGGLLCRVLQNGFSALSKALGWSTMSQGVPFWAESESVVDLLLVFSPGYFDTWYQQLLSWGFGWGKWLVGLFVVALL